MIQLKGKPVADSVFAELSNQLPKWAESKWAVPSLAVILVGDDPASEVYVANKQKACQQLEFKSEIIRMSAESSESEVAATIQKLNLNSSVDAILLQLPLPKHLDSKKLTNLISADKDADGLTQASLGSLMAQQQTVTSCTPAGILRMLDYYKIDLTNKKVTVVGRSLIVGLPLFHLLLQRNATVTLCHSKTVNTKEILSQSDISIIAIGHANYFKVTDFKKGSVVIDVGIHRLASGLCGDVDSTNAETHLSAKSPVPGGVGLMTIAMLMQNTFTLALRNRLAL